MTDSTGCYHDAPTAMETFLGGRFDVSCPTIESVRPRDIAHSLSLICRYMGQCKKFYSVGEHSIYCHDEARRRGYQPSVCLMCLVHDGAEAYVSDMARPVKLTEEMIGYNKLEQKIQEFVYRRFIREIGADVHSVLCRQLVKGVDNAVLAAEVPRIMRGKGKDWSGLDKIKPARIPWWQWRLYRLSPKFVEWGFLRRLKRYGVKW